MKRIQRKRTKGWRMPANAIYVGRPSKWGNPFSHKKYNEFFSLEGSIKRYKEWLLDVLKEDPDFLDELKGKDLACWCPLDQPCHADILLEFLNHHTQPRDE